MVMKIKPPGQMYKISERRSIVNYGSIPNHQSGTDDNSQHNYLYKVLLTDFSPIDKFTAENRINKIYLTVVVHFSRQKIFSNSHTVYLLFLVQKKFT